MVWSRVADSELLHKQNHCLQIPANGFCILWLLAALIRTRNLMLIDGIMGGLHLQRNSSFLFPQTVPCKKHRMHTSGLLFLPWAAVLGSIAVVF